MEFHAHLELLPKTPLTELPSNGMDPTGLAVVSTLLDETHPPKQRSSWAVVYFLAFTTGQTSNSKRRQIDMKLPSRVVAMALEFRCQHDLQPT
jgi:hypothetical protein